MESRKITMSSTPGGKKKSARIAAKITEKAGAEDDADEIQMRTKLTTPKGKGKDGTSPRKPALPADTDEITAIKKQQVCVASGDTAGRPMKRFAIWQNFFIKRSRCWMCGGWTLTA